MGGMLIYILLSEILCCKFGHNCFMDIINDNWNQIVSFEGFIAPPIESEALRYVIVFYFIT